MARRLMVDIQLLSESFFEVVQVVPLDRVDLSLILYPSIQKLIWRNILSIQSNAGHRAPTRQLFKL